PRPRNAWIIYRCAKVEELTQLRGMRQSDISQIVGKMWRDETAEVRTEFERLSDIEKAEHQMAYPDYRFRPMKKADK
ncbi:high mobility group box domain-containing protein, partial [Gautieria morchelliformis]